MTFKSEGSNLNGEFRVILPYSTVTTYIRNSREHVSDKLKADNPMAQAVAASSVSISARLGEVNMSLNDILNLAPGDVIELGQSPHSPIDVLVQGVPKFKAEIVQKGGKVALKVTHINSLTNTRKAK
jgi:flagellar motor switch protein FliM